jgi:hypothetical protein
MTVLPLQEVENSGQYSGDPGSDRIPTIRPAILASVSDQSEESLHMRPQRLKRKKSDQ